MFAIDSRWNDTQTMKTHSVGRQTDFTHTHTHKQPHLLQYTMEAAYICSTSGNYSNCEIIIIIKNVYWPLNKFSVNITSKACLRIKLYFLYAKAHSTNLMWCMVTFILFTISNVAKKSARPSVKPTHKTYMKCNANILQRRQKPGPEQEEIGAHRLK